MKKLLFLMLFVPMVLSAQVVSFTFSSATTSNIVGTGGDNLVALFSNDTVKTAVLYFKASHDGSTTYDVIDTSLTRISMNFADSSYIILPEAWQKALRGSIQLESDSTESVTIYGILEETSIF